MRRNLVALSVLGVLLGGCTNYHSAPFPPDDPWNRPDGTADGGIGAEASVEASPVCTVFSTTEGQICASCQLGSTAPVVSCTAGVPTDPSTCHELSVGLQLCKVCHDAKGTLLSSTCGGANGWGANWGANGCRGSNEGDDVCITCGDGASLTKICQPAKIVCSMVERGSQICLECNSGAKLVSSQCAEKTQTCSIELEGGLPCLVCRDGSGLLLSSTCQ